MSREIFYCVAFIAGLGVAIQAGVNSQLRIMVQNPLLTALISFLVGTAGLIIIYLIYYKSIPMPPETPVSEITWWKWTGGMLGVFYIVSMIIVAPKIGAANALGFAVAGQLFFAVILDHFGLIGFEVKPITWIRIAGVLFLLLGVYLIQRK